MLKIVQINPITAWGSQTVIAEPLNKFISNLKNKGTEIRNITYINDNDGIITKAMVEYYEN